MKKLLMMVLFAGALVTAGAAMCGGGSCEDRMQTMKSGSSCGCSATSCTCGSSCDCGTIGDGCGCHGETKKHFARKVIAAVSKTGLNSEQVQKVTDAVNLYKQAKMEAKQSWDFPLEAFKDDAFDKKAFREAMMRKPAAKIDAKSDLIESIYAILNAEQRKIFKREFTAPMTYAMIKENMAKGYMLPKIGHGCGKKGM